MGIPWWSSSEDLSLSLPCSGSIPGQGAEIPATHVEQPKSKQTKKVKIVFFLYIVHHNFKKGLLCPGFTTSSAPLGPQVMSQWHQRAVTSAQQPCLSWLLHLCSALVCRASSSRGPFPALTPFPHHFESIIGWRCWNISNIIKF